MPSSDSVIFSLALQENILRAALMSLVTDRAPGGSDGIRSDFALRTSDPHPLNPQIIADRPNPPGALVTEPSALLILAESVNECSETMGTMFSSI
jgi:hypothetical protein